MRFLQIFKAGLVWVFLTGIVTFAQTDTETIELEFINDIAMGIPTQDVYVDAGLVVRPAGELTEMMLAQPVYNSMERHDADYEEPFDIGPFEPAEPLGFTLGDWLATTGTGTYKADGDQATIDLQFEHLVPNGLYTLWCLEIAGGAMNEAPCGAPDGSENTFTATEDGSARVTMDIDAFPPSTEETFYEIAIAYHSDGQTYAELAGDFGKNVHASIWFDFFAEHNNLDVVNMEFINETAWGIPIQDVYVDAGLVIRPQGKMSEALLEQPLYSTATETPFDSDGIFGIEPTFNVGPFEKGIPLGLTLGEWLSATGKGTYTIDGDRATLDFLFEGLVPEGVYTLWCVEIVLPPDLAISEQPCGQADGSENEFVADEEGNATFNLEMEAFPPSTESTIYELALAYHSDGQTYGERAGEFGHNVHVHLVYDFYPPEAE
jgi:hypothetical protein